MKSKKILPTMLAAFSCLPASITKSTEKKQISAPAAATAGFVGGIALGIGGTSFALYPKYKGEMAESAKKDNEICDLKDKLKNTELELKKNKEDKKKLLQALGYPENTVVDSVLDFCKKANKFYTKFVGSQEIRIAMSLQLAKKVGHKDGTDQFLALAFSKNAPLDIGLSEEGKKRIAFYVRSLQHYLKYLDGTGTNEDAKCANYFEDQSLNPNNPFWQD